MFKERRDSMCIFCDIANKKDVDEMPAEVLRHLHIFPRYESDGVG